MSFRSVIEKIGAAFLLLTIMVQDAFAVYTDATDMADGSREQFGAFISIAISFAGLAGVILFIAGLLSAYNTHQAGGGRGGQGYGKALMMCVIGVLLCTVYGTMKFFGNSFIGGSEMHAVEDMGLGN